MALTKYVSPFPYLNMMYLEFPFSFQRCHPFMWALSLQPNITLANITLAQSQSWQIDQSSSCPLNAQKKFVSYVRSFLTSDEKTLSILWIPSNLTQQLFYIPLDDPFYRLGTIHTKHPCKCIFWKLSLIVWQWRMEISSRSVLQSTVLWNHN